MSEEIKTTTQPQYSNARVITMIGAVIFISIIIGFGNFKFMPMQDAIMDFFHIAEGAYGYLNTASGWISVICAIPLGFLVRKLPCNISVSVGFGVAIGGIAIQCVAKGFVLFVIGRMIEGAGSSMIALVTGSLILNLVPKHRISIFSSVMIFAGILPQVVMTKGGTALMQNSGLAFQQIFVIIAIVYACTLVLWLCLVPFSLKIHGVGSAAKPTREQTIRVMKNRSGILVAIANIFLTFTTITWVAYVYKYLTLKGFTPNEAADIYSTVTIIGLVSMLVFGVVSDKLKTKRKLAIGAFISGAIAFVLLALLPANLIWIYVVVWGTLPRCGAGMTSASAADIAEIPADVPIVTSIKNTISQVGSIIGGILMGYLIQYCGYDFTIYCLAGGMIIGAVCWYFAKRVP